MKITKFSATLPATAVSAVLAASMLLTGCGSDDSSSTPEPTPEGEYVVHLYGDPDQVVPRAPAAVFEIDVDLRDGRTVVCLQQRGDRAGGMSCDWASATAGQSDAAQ